MGEKSMEVMFLTIQWENINLGSVRERNVVVSVDTNKNNFTMNI